jgi:hypothetical protein
MLLGKNVNIIMKFSLLVPQDQFHKNHIHCREVLKLLAFLVVEDVALFDDEVCVL